MANVTAAVNFGAGFVPTSILARESSLTDLGGIVGRTVVRARALGRDYMSQNRAAAMAVMAVRPDLSFGEALDAVERLRDMG